MSKKKSDALSWEFTNVWEQNNNPIWITSTILLTRNIEKFLFPNKLSTENQNQIYSLVTKEISTSSFVTSPHSIRAEEASPTDKEYLYEHFLSSHSFQEAHNGEGFIVDQKGQLLITINIRDHIQFFWLEPFGDLEKSLSYLTQIETAIGKTIHYAFSAKFGFLTAHPADCGTGLIVTTFLQVPALIHTKSLDDFLVKHTDESISVTGLQGRPGELIGDFLVVHNHFTLGFTEESILSALRGFTIKLLVREQGLRVQLKQDKPVEIMDKVSRAYGILLHSYQIDAIEALDALSMVKLGLDVGWIAGVEMATLNRLIFATRRAHLIKELQHEVSPIELTHKRAEYIHKALKEAKLLI